MYREGYVSQGVIKDTYSEQADNLFPSLWALVAQNELQLELNNVPGDDSKVVLPKTFWAAQAL